MSTIDASTDLSVFVGKRVRIRRSLPVIGSPSPSIGEHYGVFESLRHSEITPGFAGGILLEEPHAACRGGATGFAVPYGATITVVPAYTSVPDEHGMVMSNGYDGRYRLWTHAHGLAFDAVPRYRDGGPGTVVLDGWAKSTTNLCKSLSSPEVVAADDGQWTLTVRRLAGRGDGEPHPLDGTTYASQDDADRAAYEAGLTGFMVYRDDAERCGLPTG